MGCPVFKFITCPGCSVSVTIEFAGNMIGQFELQVPELPIPSEAITVPALVQVWKLNMPQLFELLDICMFRVTGAKVGVGVGITVGVGVGVSVGVGVAFGSGVGVGVGVAVGVGVGVGFGLHFIFAVPSAV